MIIQDFMKNALDEDIGRGDLFSQIFPPEDASAKVIAKSEGIVCGELYINELASLEEFDVEWVLKDGDHFKYGDVIMRLKGDSHTLLAIERVLLNTLHHASSIATYTNKFVKIIEGYNVKLLDTRKTRPLLRHLEKYATRTGGAVNHRMGLDDALMLKDTHLKTIDNLALFMQEARKKIPFMAKIEVECETLESAQEAMHAGADIVMCDNMTPAQLKEVVSYRNKFCTHIMLEASGNITLDTIEIYAQSGVDAISSGSLIHQSRWIDLSMKMD